MAEDRPQPSDDQPATRGDMHRIHQRLDSLIENLHREFATQSDLALLRVDIDRLNSWLTWTVRTILAVIILAVMALVITGKAAK